MLFLQVAIDKAVKVAIIRLRKCSSKQSKCMVLRKWKNIFEKGKNVVEL